MKRFLVLIFMMLFIGICPNPASADQVDGGEILSLKNQIRANPNSAGGAHYNFGIRLIGKYDIGDEITQGTNAFLENYWRRESLDLEQQRLELENKRFEQELRLQQQRVELEQKRYEQERATKERERQHIVEEQTKQKQAEIAKQNEAARIRAEEGNKIKIKADRAREAIRLNPKDAVGRNNLGEAYFDVNLYSEAIAEFKEAVSINPNYAEAHYNLGVSYGKLGNGYVAISEMSIAAKLFEKAGNAEFTARARKYLREYYAQFGYKPEDFANLNVPEIKSPEESKPKAGESSRPQPPPSPPQKTVALGTGVMFDLSVKVFTNYHVVRDAKYIKVMFVNGEMILASVSYVDESNDIAMLTLARKPNTQLRRIAFADSSKVRIGEKVFTIGYPVSNILGKEPKYSEGVINSLSGLGDDTKMYQISVPIQAGNSGSPLFNERGEVIGLITSTFSTNDALMLFGAMPQNVNFAVKSSLFADKALAQSKGVAKTRIVPVPVPFSISDFVTGVKNNIVLIETEERSSLEELKSTNQAIKQQSNNEEPGKRNKMDSTILIEKPRLSQLDNMATIPGGTFLADQGTKSVETLEIETFHIDKYEVTQANYEKVMGGSPSYFKNCPNCPVESVTWVEADSYCKKVGKRLPTEWEWEKAAKSGSSTLFYWGNAPDAAYGWWEENSSKKTHPVGEKKANGSGVYDMAGNVSEWTSSDYGNNEKKVFRGGSWFDFAHYTHSAYRNGFTPENRYSSVGFRCAK